MLAPVDGLAGACWFGFILAIVSRSKSRACQKWLRLRGLSAAYTPKQPTRQEIRNCLCQRTHQTPRLLPTDTAYPQPVLLRTKPIRPLCQRWSVLAKNQQTELSLHQSCQWLLTSPCPLIRQLASFAPRVSVAAAPRWAARLERSSWIGVDYVLIGLQISTCPRCAGFCGVPPIPHIHGVCCSSAIQRRRVKRHQRNSIAKPDLAIVGAENRARQPPRHLMRLPF